MLNYLPHDILQEISKYLNNYQRYNMYNILDVDEKTETYKGLIVNKLILYYKLNKIINNFKEDFCINIKKHFILPQYFTRKCYYYAPVAPNGICRFCNQFENKHLYREKTTNILIYIWKDDIY
tara:strand:- start:46 stop:414 length:369 start_codon:yes stop_codon:yes gene_type:complete